MIGGLVSPEARWILVTGYWILDSDNNLLFYYLPFTVHGLLLAVHRSPFTFYSFLFPP